MTKIETKLKYFILLSVTIDAVIFTEQNKFFRIFRVAQKNLNDNILSSYNETTSIVMCAAHCKNNLCLTFAYSEFEKTCETYSHVEVEEVTAPVSKKIMFYSLKLRSCADVPLEFPSCVYPIEVTPGKYTDMFCDLDTAKGPWTVIQKRGIPGAENFYRGWEDYKNGFGDFDNEFWIGNDILHLLAKSPRILRIELESWKGTTGYAEYSRFQVDSERQLYRLTVEDFSGTISNDALSHSHDSPFTTYDRDNDESPGHVYNCAETHMAGWWYRQCAGANLNGLLGPDFGVDNVTTIFWWNFPYSHRLATPLKASKMMIR